jgi:uncharacterized protein YjbI with pentapeptide repeats
MQSRLAAWQGQFETLYGVMVRRVIGFSNKNSRLWKEDKYALANLEGDDLEGIEFDASKLHALRISSSTIRQSSFLHLKGDLDLGVGMSRSLLHECVFANASIGALNCGYVQLEQCEFRDCDIRDLWAFDADFKDCKFSGFIRNGAFNIAPKESRFAHNERVFMGNDFSKCQIAMDIFRGGIDLTEQHFSKSDEARIIYNAPMFLRAFDKKLRPKLSGQVVDRFVRHVRRAIESYKQIHVFIAEKEAKALGESYSHIQELMRDISKVHS